MHRLICWIAFAVLAMTATAAQAAQFLYTVSGTVSGDLNHDDYGMFDVADGTPFTARFLVDDGVGTASYAYGLAGASASGGGMVAAGTASPVRGALTVGGATFAIRQGNYRLDPIYNEEFGEGYGPAALREDFGSVRKEAGMARLSLSSGYAESYVCCYPFVHEGSTGGEFLELALYGASFASPDYREPGIFAVTGGGYFARSQTYNGNPGNLVQIQFSATSLRVAHIAAVPEVATWLMLLAGVGVAGIAPRAARSSAGFRRSREGGRTMPSTFKLWMRAAALLAGTLPLATPAQAAQYLYTVTGQVVLDELSFDQMGLFGPTLAPTFSAAFVVDDAVPEALYSYGAAGSSATGGGTVAPGTLPPVSASLTIGGITYGLRQGNSSSGPIIGPDGDPYGGTSLERDAGTIARSLSSGRLDLTVSYYEESFCCYPAGYHFDASADFLDFSLFSAGFTGPDYRQLGTFALIDSGGFFQSYVQSGPFPGAITQIRFQGETLTVASLAAVPEAGAWLMMIFGIGVAGRALRRQQGGSRARPRWPGERILSRA